MITKVICSDGEIRMYVKQLPIASISAIAYIYSDNSGTSIVMTRISD